MAYLTVCLAALAAAGLTFFSGFGLGTLLMPAFALFFPLEVAIAATAVVHLANNLFKLALVGRHADRRVLLRFALPAIPAALLGAWLLSAVSRVEPVATWSLSGEHRVTLVGLVIAAIMLIFAAMELAPGFDKWSFHPRALPLGGVISGFFGGLSGHQGALRSAFLVRCGLTKEAFIGTGVAAAVIVDVVRLAVYGMDFAGEKFTAVGDSGGWWLVAAATVAAFIGSYAGSRLVKNVTLRTVRICVGVMLVALGLAIGAGVV